jgi:hypothetical protein
MSQASLFPRTALRALTCSKHELVPMGASLSGIVWWLTQCRGDGVHIRSSCGSDALTLALLNNNTIPGHAQDCTRHLRKTQRTAHAFAPPNHISPQRDLTAKPFLWLQEAAGVGTRPCCPVSVLGQCTGEDGRNTTSRTEHDLQDSTTPPFLLLPPYGGVQSARPAEACSFAQ